MNAKLLELALKKQRLQLEAAAQRVRLAQGLAAWAPVFAAADGATQAVRWLRAHPQWVAGAAVVLAVTRPRALFRWLRRGFFAWQLVRRARRALDSLTASR